MWTGSSQDQDQSGQSWKQARSQAWFFTLLCLISLWPETAFSATDTLGAIVCNINTTSNGYVRMLSAACYISGLIILVRGALLLKKSGDNPNESVAKGIAHLVVGGILISFPWFVGVLQRSLFSAAAGAGSFACSGTTPTAGAAGLDVMMQNLVRDIHGPMFTLVSIISILAGLTLIFRGLLKASKTGTDPRASSPRDIITYLLIGAVLVSMGSVLPSVMQTIFGSDSISSMKAYDGIQWSNFVGAGTDVTAAKNTVRAVLAFIQIIGVISFLRGWLMLKTAIEGGQATVPQGITHIIGGAMAINIDVMLKIIDTTFGTGIIK